jgi:hypothetical protein
MIGFDPRVFSAGPAQHESRLSVDRIGSGDGGTQMHRYPSVDGVAHEPAWRGPQMTLDYFDVGSLGGS